MSKDFLACHKNLNFCTTRDVRNGSIPAVHAYSPAGGFAVVGLRLAACGRSSLPLLASRPPLALWSDGNGDVRIHPYRGQYWRDDRAAERNRRRWFSPTSSSPVAIRYDRCTSTPAVCGAIMRRCRCRRAAGCRPRLLAIPPSSEKISQRFNTSRRTSAGVPKGSVCCVSTPPPQKTSRPLYFAFSIVGSMPLAEHCTGLMMSMPASIIDSKNRSDEPSERPSGVLRGSARIRWSTSRRSKGFAASLSSV